MSSINSQHVDPSTTNTTVEGQAKQGEIVEVWDDNLEDEMARISELLDQYPYVAMDTEFPGVVVQNENIVGYQLIKSNVDILKLIQVGICLADSQGNTPQPVSCWQFNLKFDPTQDLHSHESIEMLKDAGINFEHMSAKGIDPLRFADEFIQSGLVMNEEVHWITFHGAFDFAYLIKVFTNSLLPASLDKFKLQVKQNFPILYDIKIMMKEVSELRNGSLQKLARDLDVRRVGTMHQAGSDSDLTLRCFFKLKELYFQKGIPEKYWNKVFGLAAEFVPQTQPQHNQSHVHSHAQSQPPMNRQVTESHRIPQYAPFAQANHMAYFPFAGDFQSHFYFGQGDLSGLYGNEHISSLYNTQA